MAGDWIKMREDLPEDPAVIAIAAATGLDEYGVVGRLHKFWTWTGRHTLDGNARGVTVSWIDRYLHAEGFAAAMIAAGWLVETSDGVSQPNFERHNGQAAKQRALTSKRVANHKAKSNARVNAKGNAPVNARTVSDALPREEKRREDSIPPTPSPTESVGDEAEWGRLEGVLLGEGVVSARLAIDAAIADRIRTVTDVTGFGLAGHLLEMLRASDVSATVSLKLLQVLPGAIELLRQG